MDRNARIGITGNRVGFTVNPNERHCIPQRSLMLFLSFVVIFITLVVQGVTLPLLIRMLRVSRNPDQDDREKERELRLLLADSTLIFIDNELQSPLSEQGKNLIRQPHLDTISALSKQLRLAQEHSRDIIEVRDAQLVAQQEIQQFQRQILITFYKDGTYSQSLLRRIEQELDHAELLTGKMGQKKENALTKGF